MPRPTSFRLDDQLMKRLEIESEAASTSVTSLVSSLLDEGLKSRRFPGVVYRPGPTGRRAALVDGPDVWEVIRDLQRAPGRGMERVEHLARELGITVSLVSCQPRVVVGHAHWDGAGQNGTHPLSLQGQVPQQSGTGTRAFLDMESGQNTQEKFPTSSTTLACISK